MPKRINIIRIIAVTAFVIYVVSLLFPYQYYRDYGYYEEGIRYYPSGKGYYSDYVLFLVFFIPVLVFLLVRHTLAMKAFSLIACSLLFVFACLAWSEDFSGEYSKPGIGFYLFLLSVVTLLILSVIKLRIPVPRRMRKNNELLDDF